jgi:hypothetical protein
MRPTIAFVFLLLVLACATDASAQIPVSVKRPAFVNDLSKRTDDLVSYLKRHAKKEVALVPDDGTVPLTLELISVSKVVTGTRNVNHLASAIAGTVITESGDSYTAVARLCIASKEHCEEFTANADFDWEAAWKVAAKVKKFVTENAAALRER